MAPTETLAEQHFATLQKLMPGELRAGGAADRLDARPAAAPTCSASSRSGELQAARRHARADRGAPSSSTASRSRSSTSSTASASTSAARWTARRRTGLAPHVLHMTATPIPRTLALTALRRPRRHRAARAAAPGGGRSTTHVASTERERARAYERIREELRAGRQAFVVCPLVEESEALQARAATAEYERLRDDRAAATSASCCCTARCGRARSRRRWRAFAAGGADVLVATTVIEVGIDVPNASVMLVEGAERYGISQLHQLRGRIGRGRARVGLRAVRAARSRRGCARWPSTATASSSPRSTSSCAARGRCSARASRGSPQFRVARLPEDAELLDGARGSARAAGGRPGARRCPSTRCSAGRSQAAYGAEALDPIPA